MRLPFPAPASVRSLTDPAGLYIHIPFCRKKCAYCDFYSRVPSCGGTEDYVKALIKEMKKWGGELKNRPIDTVYIGGGTPSLLGDMIIPLAEAAKSAFNILPGAEVTAEVNPESAAEFLPAARKAGVNRISIGAQSGNDAMLRRLGRLHTADDTAKAVAAARNAGFDNISLDLMIGLPESGQASLDADTDFILSLSPQHISAYILKSEPGTALFESGTLLPDDEATAEQYLSVCDRLEKSGYSHYEISNFALPGFESRHNLRYWKDGEYLGIGPAAHSFLNGRRFYYPRDIKAFCQNPATVYDGAGGGKEEKLMLGLRLSEGVDMARYGLTPDTEKKLALMENAGYITKKGSHISLTDKGMLVSNSIIAELME